MAEATIIEKLRVALKDEQDAAEFYPKLADEIDKKGFSRRAYLLRSVAADEKRHVIIVKDALEEVKTIGALVGAAIPTGKFYWWVRLGDTGEYERFDTMDEAKKYVEERSGEHFSKAKWINAYGFTLGPFVGRKYITFLEGDEHGTPTERHLWGKASQGGTIYANGRNPVYR